MSSVTLSSQDQRQSQGLNENHSQNDNMLGDQITRDDARTREELESKIAVLKDELKLQKIFIASMQDVFIAKGLNYDHNGSDEEKNVSDIVFVEQNRRLVNQNNVVIFGVPEISDKVEEAEMCVKSI